MTTQAPTRPSARSPALFPALPEGSCIGVVAPAGPASADAVACIGPLLARHGHRARVFPGCHRRTGYLAGSDPERLADLHAALRDPDVAALWCLRGGHGCLRLVDRIDQALVRRQGKALIGYSDITALHALWCRAGAPSLHAPMAASDLALPGRDGDAEAVFGLLRRGCRAGDVLAPTLLQHDAALRVGGCAEGVLVGGNLSLVAALLGTPFAWQSAGTILFLEDVTEQPYRVDRLLAQLRLAGVLDGAAGFLLGSFTGAAHPLAELQDALGHLGKPVLAGWPAGHGTPNEPLPLGVRVRLDAGAGELTLLGGQQPAP